MAKNEVGDWFEGEFKEAFKNIEKSNRVFWHRFPDSKAARAMMAAQPADFLFRQRNGDAWLIEVKASEAHECLSKCFSMIRKTQIAFARNWGDCGGPSAFVFFSDITHEVQVWMGQQVVDHNAKVQKMKEPDYVFPYQELEQRILEIFK